MEMKNTSAYNREYYLKNKERISENQKKRIKNMTEEEREVYLNRMKDWYRNRKGRFVSKSELREENKKLKDSNTILKKGGQVVFTLEKRIDELLEENEKLKEENKELKNMINTTIGIAYDKDDFDAIEYLVHERDGSECFTLKDIKDGKTKRKGNRND